MKIGFVGLGKMGGNMVLRLSIGSPDKTVTGGHQVVGFARDPNPDLTNVQGVEVVTDLAEMVSKGFYATTQETEIDAPDAIVICVPTPLSGDGTITLSSIANWEADAAASSKTQLARTVFSQADISLLSKRSGQVADPHSFNCELSFKPGPITNQKSSGRCWLFATTNILRYEIMKKLNLKEFQLSQVRGDLIYTYVS